MAYCKYIPTYVAFDGHVCYSQDELRAYVADKAQIYIDEFVCKATGEGGTLIHADRVAIVCSMAGGIRSLEYFVDGLYAIVHGDGKHENEKGSEDD